MPELGDFPPAEHLSRELGIAYRFPAPDRMELTVPAVDEVLRPDGTVQSEAVTTLLDETLGFVAVSASTPDWGSTASLVFRFTGQPVEPTGRLRVEGRVVKAGKRLVFVEGDLWWDPTGDGTGDHHLVALAAGEFARVGRRAHNVDLEMPTPDPDEVFEMGDPGSALPEPYPERLGQRVVDGRAGVLELDLTGYVRNSSGILHGGVLGGLAVAAAEAASGEPALEAHVQYLSAGREGPFRSRAAMVDRHPSATLWRTETVDLGVDGADAAGAGEGAAAADGGAGTPEAGASRGRRMTRATVTTRGSTP